MFANPFESRVLCLKGDQQGWRGVVGTARQQDSHAVDRLRWSQGWCSLFIFFLCHFLDYWIEQFSFRVQFCTCTSTLFFYDFSVSCSSAFLAFSCSEKHPWIYKSIIHVAPNLCAYYHSVLHRTVRDTLRLHNTTLTRLWLVSGLAADVHDRSRPSSSHVRLPSTSQIPRGFPAELLSGICFSQLPFQGLQRLLL